MTAGTELAARRAAAAAALADFGGRVDTWADRGCSPPSWRDEARRLARELRTVLDAGAAVLDALQLATLGLARADAIAYRQPGGECTRCDEHPAGLCADHAADLDRAEDYAELAAGLGIEAGR